jgi:hypothetical protein
MNICTIGTNIEENNEKLAIFIGRLATALSDGWRVLVAVFLV